MRNNKLDKLDRRFSHEHRFLTALILSELIILAFIKLWPDLPAEYDSRPEPLPVQEVFANEQIPTRQATTPAAPPRPQMPIPVPNDEIIEEDIEFEEFDNLISDSDPLDITGIGEKGTSDKPVGSPERPPTIVRIVEPEVPDAAKRANLKAEIFVNFLVGTDGRVEEVFVAEIRVYEGDEFKTVNDIGYGLLGATLEAASKWIFRPARDQGRAVRTYTTQVFSFGF